MLELQQQAVQLAQLGAVGQVLCSCSCLSLCACSLSGMSILPMVQVQVLRGRCRGWVAPHEHALVVSELISVCVRKWKGWCLYCLRFFGEGEGDGSDPVADCMAALFMRLALCKLAPVDVWSPVPAVAAA